MLLAIAGPNYAGALKEGNVAQQIDRCLTWVKAEASEAASLIDSCVPHGKPMLAQAQKRLEVLESLKLFSVWLNPTSPTADRCCCGRASAHADRGHRAMG